MSIGSNCKGQFAHRHPVLYFDEPDTLVFKVQGILFRPHVFVLRRYCDVFRDMIALNGATTMEGSDDSNPIELVDVQLADGDYAGISPEGFELAIRSLYPEMIQDDPPADEHEWTLVLDASRRWQSSYLRCIALSNLSKLSINPTTRLALATKYTIPEWIPDIYSAICRRQQDLSDYELSLISQRHSLGLMNTRHELLCMICDDLLGGCGGHGVGCSNARMRRARGLLTHIPWQPTSLDDIIREGGREEGSWCGYAICKNMRQSQTASWETRLANMIENLIRPVAPPDPACFEPCSKIPEAADATAPLVPRFAHS